MTSSNLDSLIRDTLPQYFLNPVLCDLAANYSAMANEDMLHGQIYEFDARVYDGWSQLGFLELDLMLSAHHLQRPLTLKDSLRYILMFLCAQEKIHPGLYMITAE